MTTSLGTECGFFKKGRGGKERRKKRGKEQRTVKGGVEEYAPDGSTEGDADVLWKRKVKKVCGGVAATE